MSKFDSSAWAYLIAIQRRSRARPRRRGNPGWDRTKTPLHVFSILFDPIKYTAQ